MSDDSDLKGGGAIKDAAKVGTILHARLFFRAFRGVLRHPSRIRITG